MEKTIGKKVMEIIKKKYLNTPGFRGRNELFYSSDHRLFLNILSIISLAFVLISYSVHVFFDSEFIARLTLEDGFFETSGAILFLFASLIFFFTYYSTRSTHSQFPRLIKGNIIFLLLSIIFLFGFLEEISWGQRYLNIETPEMLKKINLQQEINIHNLKIFHRLNENGHKSGWDLMLNIDRLFSVFWFSCCIVLPLLCAFNNPFKNIINKLNIPILPLFFGLVFFINYITSKLILINQITPIRTVIEIKEFNCALLFFIVSIWFFKNHLGFKKIQRRKNNASVLGN